MEQKEAFEKIIKIIRPYVKNEAALQEISETTRFIEDLRINSARLVDIILTLEDELNLSITDEEAEKMRTMGDAFNLINEKVKTPC